MATYPEDRYLSFENTRVPKSKMRKYILFKSILS